MPLIRITTNINIDSPTLNTALKIVSESVATMLGKPESYVMLDYQRSPHMLFAGTGESTAYIELKSLGLEENKTTEFSKMLCTLLNDQFGIQGNRIYIEFSNPERHMWGWDKRTF